LDARLGPVLRTPRPPPISTNDRPYTAPSKRDSYYSPDRSSTVPSIKREPISPPPKKNAKSKHRFTSADSDNEDDSRDGDVNIKFDMVKFYGKPGTKDEVEVFIANNELIFNLKPRQFRTDTQKINFMATLFREAAARWYKPYQAMERIGKPAWCLNYSLFVQELIDEFGDPKPMDSASDQILELKMKTKQDVREFYREFSEISVKITDWGEPSFARLFFKGLTPEIQQLISNANNDFPKTLKGMRDVAVQAYRRRESLQGELKEPRDGRTRSTPVDDDTPRGMFNITPRGQPAATKSMDPVPRFNDKYPRSGIQLGNYLSRPPSNYGRSTEERNRLTAQGRCWGCEETGHMYADCPKNKNNEGKQYLGDPPGPTKPRVRMIQLYEEEPEQALNEDAEEEPKNGSATLT
jgi:hypothetical protein